MLFEYEPGCVSPRSAPHFQRLLVDIRKHLYASRTTRAAYVEIGEEFHSSLSIDLQHQYKVPTDNDFKRYIESQWPTIKTVNRRKDKLLWGYVFKGDGTPHTIHILSDVVASAERAVSILILAILMQKTHPRIGYD